MNTYDRNLSCATTADSKDKKPSISLRIDCNDTGKAEFYDAGTMNNISSITTVPSKQNSSMFNKPKSPTNQSWLNSIRLIPCKVLLCFKTAPKKANTSTTVTTSDSCSEELHDTYRGSMGKQSQNSSETHVGKIVRHSYSDPHLSPGSTAVGDDDEERQGYFGIIPEKKKRSPRRWIAAILMIVVGSLIALTFVLVGLGKALKEHDETVSAKQLAHNASAPLSRHSSTLSVIAKNSTYYQVRNGNLARLEMMTIKKLNEHDESFLP
ncbi:hypothetical protein BD770DRAFT_451455 [Pilaira anomala]|nr:hypothetical protein BD770DRAFT_451455 [Pilaira anomala]